MPAVHRVPAAGAAAAASWLYIAAAWRRRPILEATGTTTTAGAETCPQTRSSGQERRVEAFTSEPELPGLMAEIRAEIDPGYHYYYYAMIIQASWRRRCGQREAGWQRIRAEEDRRLGDKKRRSSNACGKQVNASRWQAKQAETKKAQLAAAKKEPGGRRGFGRGARAGRAQRRRREQDHREFPAAIQRSLYTNAAGGTNELQFKTVRLKSVDQELYEREDNGVCAIRGKYFLEDYDAAASIVTKQHLTGPVLMDRYLQNSASLFESDRIIDDEDIGARVRAAGVATINFKTDWDIRSSATGSLSFGTVHNPTLELEFDSQPSANEGTTVDIVIFAEVNNIMLYETNSAGATGLRRLIG